MLIKEAGEQQQQQQGRDKAMKLPNDVRRELRDLEYRLIDEFTTGYETDICDIPIIKQCFKEFRMKFRASKKQEPRP
jgi:hypothetical protein